MAVRGGKEGVVSDEGVWQCVVINREGVALV